MIYKNQASASGRGVYIQVWNDYGPVTDPTDITCQITQDGGSATATATSHPTYIGTNGSGSGMVGLFWMPLTQAEVNCNKFVILPISTANNQTTISVNDTTDSVATLDSQAVRDAMKLAPSAGSPAANSVDANQSTIIGQLDVKTSAVILGATQSNYAPSKAGDAMALTSGERTTLATAVWASATRTLSSFGTLIADIWAYATRTITSGGITAAEIWAYSTRTLTDVGGSTLTAIKAVTDKLAVMIESYLATYRFNSTALSNAGGGSGGILVVQTIDSTSVNTSSITQLSIIKGNDYLIANGKFIDFFINGAPDLTGATIFFVTVANGVTISQAAVATSVGGTIQTIRLELDRTVTSLLVIGTSTFDLTATTNSGTIKLINAGSMLVQ